MWQSLRFKGFVPANKIVSAEVLKDQGSLTAAFAWFGFLALIGIGWMLSTLGMPTWLVVVLSLLLFGGVINAVWALQKWVNKHDRR
jgi:hypothetical protein